MGEKFLRHLGIGADFAAVFPHGSGYGAGNGAHAAPGQAPGADIAVDVAHDVVQQDVGGAR